MTPHNNNQKHSDETEAERALSQETAEAYLDWADRVGGPVAVAGTGATPYLDAAGVTVWETKRLDPDFYFIAHPRDKSGNHNN